MVLRERNLNGWWVPDVIDKIYSLKLIRTILWLVHSTKSVPQITFTQFHLIQPLSSSPMKPKKANKSKHKMFIHLIRLWHPKNFIYLFMNMQCKWLERRTSTTRRNITTNQKVTKQYNNDSHEYKTKHCRDGWMIINFVCYFAYKYKTTTITGLFTNISIKRYTMA